MLLLQIQIQFISFESLVDKVFESKPSTDEAIKFMDKVCDGKIQSFIDKSYKDLADYIHAYDQKMVMKREVHADKVYGLQRKDMF